MKQKIVLIHIIILFMLSGCLEDNPSVIIPDNSKTASFFNYQPGALGINSTISDSVVELGEYITFHDETNADTRSWTFEGGNPAKSNAETVIVHYYESGKFDYSLAVFKDSIVDSLYHRNAITAFEKGLYLAKRNEPSGAVVELKLAKENTSEAFKEGLYSALFLSSDFPNGFNIVEINNGFTYWGPDADFAKITEDQRVEFEPTFDFYRGSITQNDAEFSANESEIYYLGVDFEVNKVVLLPFYQWSLFGNALENESNEDLILTTKNIGTTSFSFSRTEVAMQIGYYRVRYNNGDFIVIDSTYDNGDFLEPGIRLYCYLGSYNGFCSWGNYEMEQDSENEYFNVKLDWTKSNGFIWQAKTY